MTTCPECGHGESAHRYYSRCIGTVNQPDCRCLRPPDQIAKEATA